MLTVSLLNMPEAEDYKSGKYFQGCVEEDICSDAKSDKLAETQ